MNQPLTNKQKSYYDCIIDIITMSLREAYESEEYKQLSKAVTKREELIKKRFGESYYKSYKHDITGKEMYLIEKVVASSLTIGFDLGIKTKEESQKEMPTGVFEILSSIIESKR